MSFSRMKTTAYAAILLGSGPTPAFAQATAAPAAPGSGTPASTAGSDESYPANAVGDGATVRGYNVSRWAEDWSSMQDPAKRRDGLDRLKFLPLDPGGNIYLTLSGELRLRVNHTTNPDLREREAQRQDIVRAVAGADLHVGSHVRFYGELAHGGLGGRNLGVASPLLKNDLVIQQSFVDVSGKVGEFDAGVRYGRQTFSDGPGLLVVPRDNNTILFVYNGVRAWARNAVVRASLFDFRTTQLGQAGIGDDIIDTGRRFKGISAGVVLPRSLVGGSNLYLDPFIWRLRDRNAQRGATTGYEVRNFYGVRLSGDAGRLAIDWSVNRQTGRFDDRRLSAWQIFLEQSYRLGRPPSAPRLGFHADYATGGGSYSGGTLRTALAPFGNNIYYSYQLYATPTNLIAIAPNFSFQPASKVRTTLEYQRSWRADVHDAVYRANGSPFVGTQDSSGRMIADTLRAQLVWSMTPRLTLTTRYEHLIARASLTEAGYRNSDFMAGWLSLRF